MHMNHKAGDKMYVDYAGKTLSIIEKNGRLKKCSFCCHIRRKSTHLCRGINEPTERRFCGFCRECYAFFEGVPAAIVPDNLKSAVIKSSRFEPTINETLADLAEHYETTILPARAYKPRDKSLAEGAVKILYQRIYVHLKQNSFIA